MGRGFLAGIFWGGIVGIGLLVVSSQVLDRQQLSFPKPEAEQVEVPAGTEFNQARPETEPVAPKAETRPGGEAASGVIPPEDAMENPPAFDTSALEVPTPKVEAPGSLGSAPEGQSAGAVDVTGAGSAPGTGQSATLAQPETPGAAPKGVAEAPAAVASSAEPQPAPGAVPTVEPGPAVPGPDVAVADAAPMQPTPPDVTGESAMPETRSAAAPAAAGAPGAQEAPATEPSPQVVTRLEPGATQAQTPAPAANLPGQTGSSERLPQIGGAGAGPEIISPPPSGGETPAPAPAPSVSEEMPPSTGPEVLTPAPAPSGGEPRTEVVAGAEPPSSNLPVVRRLPGTPVAPVETQSETATPAPDMSADGPALEAWRMPFENPKGLPVMSVVLIHTGDQPLAAAALARLPAEIDFAVNAGQPGAAAVAADYRAAGRELVMIPALPENATPQDVEQALRANFDRVPQAVAVMDTTGGNFQSDRAAVNQVVDVIAATGHGLITFPRGLNTAHQRAEREGIPTGLIFRNIDEKGESAAVIGRALDRAAFRARQGEPVILVGSTRPETLAAVETWAAENADGQVLLAPVSATLMAGR